MRDSLAVEIALDRLSTTVGADLGLGAHLEFGTRDMAPRPWLAPAAENVWPKFQARIEDTVREGIRQAPRR